MKLRSVRRPAIVATATVAVFAVAFGGQAAADAFITGKDVKNNSLSGADIKNGSVSGADIKTNSVTWRDIENGTVRSTEIRNGSIELKDLSDEAIEDLNEGLDEFAELVVDGLNSLAAYDGEIDTALENLRTRIKAAEGTIEDLVAAVDAVEADVAALGLRVDALEDSALVSSNWGNILRNVIGSASTQLRNGPYAANFGLDAAPPAGTGSLEINVVGQIPGTDGNTASKAAFGNEVDFVGDSPASLGSPSFWVYTTGENIAKGANNLPNIAVELNPDLPGRTYTTMNFVPTAAATPGDWTQFTAADGYWYFTGGTGADTNCEQADECTLAEAIDALGDNAAIFSVGVSKGRDYEFHGAVDALQVGGVTYDFEARGVVAPVLSAAKKK